jgi:hypothetical protein
MWVGKPSIDLSSLPNPNDRLGSMADALLALCSTLGDADAVPALTVYAVCAWSVGRTVEASSAIGRVLDADPDYTLAQLMKAILAIGGPASSMRVGAVTVVEIAD